MALWGLILVSSLVGYAAGASAWVLLGSLVSYWAWEFLRA